MSVLSIEQLGLDKYLNGHSQQYLLLKSSVDLTAEAYKRILKTLL